MEEFYKVISHTDLAELINQVNSLSNNGWMVLGGIAVRNWRSWEYSTDSTVHHEAEFFQAMQRQRVKP